MKDKIVFLMSLIIAISFTSDFAHAERRFLSPPELVQLPEAKEFLDKSYVEKIDKARGLLKKYNDEELSKDIAALFKTARKNKSLKHINKLSAGINKYKHRDPQKYEELNELLTQIQGDIESGKFTGNKFFVDFELDRKNRTYVYSWDEGDADVEKTWPLVPAMNLTVKGEYAPDTINNEGIMVYRYWVENRQGSKGSFWELYLENKFPQDYILDKIKSKFGRMRYYEDITSNIQLNVSYPEGYLNYFIFWFVKDRRLWQFNASDEMQYPYELQEIEGGLAGIVECYVPVVGFETFASDVEPPRQVSDVFSPKSDTSTMYMYRGKTIGPVPMPEPFNAAAFIDRIISYKDESIEQGWIDKKPAIDFVNEGLLAIKSNPGDKARIKEFIAELEQYYKRNQILSEAYALLKYNLEYLLTKM